MKATLEFDLNDPDEKLDHKRAVTATEAYIALLRIRDRLPGIDDECNCQFDLQAFHEILDDLSINLNDLP